MLVEVSGKTKKDLRHIRYCKECWEERKNEKPLLKNSWNPLKREVSKTGKNSASNRLRKQLKS